VLVASANALVKVLLAPMCAACGTTLERPFAGPVCRPCLNGIQMLSPPWCVRCGDPLAQSGASGPFCARCDRRAPAFDLARSAAPYEGPLRALIHAFKYRRRRALAAPLARCIVQAGEDVLAGADAVVPVPVHPLRLVARGFNQADDLARHLRKPVWCALRRVGNRPPQAGQPAHERETNVRGAFAVRLSWRHDARRRAGLPSLRNAAVVLIDDVMTTGATLDACSRALVEAGVRRVTALTVARTASARPARSPMPPRPSTVLRR
jgi:ComF family protein